MTYARAGTIGHGPLAVSVESSDASGEIVGLHLTGKNGRSFRFCGFHATPAESYLIREKS